jgi:hypothetical protein
MKEEVNNLYMNTTHCCEITKYDQWLTDTVREVLKHEPPTDDKVIDYVNKVYDDTFFYDPSMKKCKAAMTGIFTEYRRLYPRGTRIQDIRQFNMLVLSKIAELRNSCANFTDMIKKWNPAPKKFAESVSKLFFNVNNNDETLEYVRKFFANIHYNMGNKSFRKQGTVLYLLGQDIGGQGKGYFMDALKKWLDLRHISNSVVNITGSWFGKEFNNNLVGFVPECEYRYLDHTVVNNIIDNVDYTVKIKCVPEYSARSNMTIIAGSNHRPVEKNNRRFGVVEYNRYPYSRWTPEEKAAHDISDRTELFDTLFYTVPTAEYCMADSSVKYNYDDNIVLDKLIELYNEDELDDDTAYTKSALYDKIQSLGLDKDEYEHITKKNIEMFMMKLVYANKVKDYMNMGTHRFKGLCSFLDETAADMQRSTAGTPIEACVSRWETILNEIPEDPVIEPVNEQETVQEEIKEVKTNIKNLKELSDSGKLYEKYVNNEEELAKDCIELVRSYGRDSKDIRHDIAESLGDSVSDAVNEVLRSKFPHLDAYTVYCIKDNSIRIDLMINQELDSSMYVATVRGEEGHEEVDWYRRLEEDVDICCQEIAIYIACNGGTRMRNI